MQCPVCDHVDLLMTERQGVEIDNCPKCRGVWLDRGELDEIVVRSAGRPPASRHHGYAEDHHDAPDGHDEDRRHDDGHATDKSRSKKKGGLFGELLGGLGGD